MTTPNLVPKTVLVIAFRFALTLDVKIVLFGHQVTVFVNKRHTNDFVCCVQFQKLKFCCLLLEHLIYLPKVPHTGDTDWDSSTNTKKTKIDRKGMFCVSFFFSF